MTPPEQASVLTTAPPGSPAGGLSAPELYSASSLLSSPTSSSSSADSSASTSPAWALFASANSRATDFCAVDASVATGGDAAGTEREREREQERLARQQQGPAVMTVATEARAQSLSQALTSSLSLTLSPWPPQPVDVKATLSLSGQALPTQSISQAQPLSVGWTRSVGRPPVALNLHQAHAQKQSQSLSPLMFGPPINISPSPALIQLQLELQLEQQQLLQRVMLQPRDQSERHPALPASTAVSSGNGISQNSSNVSLALPESELAVEYGIFFHSHPASPSNESDALQQLAIAPTQPPAGQPQSPLLLPPRIVDDVHATGGAFSGAAPSVEICANLGRRNGGLFRCQDIGTGAWWGGAMGIEVPRRKSYTHINTDAGAAASADTGALRISGAMCANSTAATVVSTDANVVRALGGSTVNMAATPAPDGCSTASFDFSANSSSGSDAEPNHAIADQLWSKHK